jgi:hypothetical protein
MIQQTVSLREVCKDRKGNVLWDEPYVFSRLSAAGQWFIRDYIHYIVESCERDGDTIKTVVRRTDE